MRAASFLLIESNTTGTGRIFCQAARTLGLTPVLVCSDPRRYPYLAQDNISVLRCDTGDWANLRFEVSAYAQRMAVCGIYTSSEYWIEAASVLSRELGLPGGDPVNIKRCRNKFTQRKCLREADLLTPSFARARSTSELANALEMVGYPAVLKPTHGSGSVNVRLCQTPAEVDTHATLILNQGTNERGIRYPAEVLIESFLDGVEFSAEILNGHCVGVTEKHVTPPPYFVEVGHNYPSSATHTRAVGAVALQACKALGLQWGPAHVEVRITPKGPFVVEVNPRLAGGYIPELVRLASGIDLISNTILIACGSPIALRPSRHNFSAIRFLLGNDRPMRRNPALFEELRTLAGVEDVALYTNAELPFLRRGDFRDRIGHVITSGETTESASAVANHVLSLLTINRDHSL